MREFGVIKALGTPPWRIVRDVAAEAALLGLLGIILGVILAWPFYWLLNTYGIDTSSFTDGSMSFSGVAFDPLWKAYIGPREVFLSALMMWSFCVIASIWPAVLAARLDPVAAIRHRR
jgi:ABC-type antimicrobial peptide transport system permease subunit